MKGRKNEGKVTVEEDKNEVDESLMILDQEINSDEELQYREVTPDSRFSRIESKPFLRKFEAIYNGIDRDTGNEVLWRKMSVRGANATELSEWLSDLQLAVSLECKHLVKYHFCDIKKETEEVLLITEVMTRGTLHDYIGNMKWPKLRICQSWFRQILSGLEFLHSHSLVHGYFTTHHVYLNSYSGELKIGDYVVAALPDLLEQRKKPSHSKVSDIKSFGVLALELVFTQIYQQVKIDKWIRKYYENPSIEPQKIIRILSYIEDLRYRSLVKMCLEANEDTTIEELLKHDFFTIERTNEEILTTHKMSSNKGKHNLITRSTLNIGDKQDFIEVHILIRSAETDLKISFLYSLENDSPEGVLIEMQKELKLPRKVFLFIRSELENAINKIIVHKRVPPQYILVSSYRSPAAEERTQNTEWKTEGKNVELVGSPSHFQHSEKKDSSRSISVVSATTGLTGIESHRACHPPLGPHQETRNPMAESTFLSSPREETQTRLTKRCLDSLPAEESSTLQAQYLFEEGYQSPLNK